MTTSRTSSNTNHLIHEVVVDPGSGSQGESDWIRHFLPRMRTEVRDKRETGKLAVGLLYEYYCSYQLLGLAVLYHDMMFHGGGEFTVEARLHSPPDCRNEYLLFGLRILL